MDYKATIILACHNKEKYLDRALKSLVSQSRFTEFEIIVVDDCSTDDSVSIVTKYAEQYANIRLVGLKECSGSPSKPRNTGISLSTSDYLIFMDPDDFVINDGYSVLLTKMEEFQSDVLIAARRGVTQSGIETFIDFIDEKYTYVNQNTPEIRFDLLYRRPFILKTIYRKQLILDNGIRFNERICMSEDESFDMQCVAYAKTITKINDVVYQYTVESDDSITTGIKLTVYEQYFDILTELNRTYRLCFSDEVTAERILSLTEYYIQRMSLFQDYRDVFKACSIMYDAFDRFGWENLAAATSERAVRLRDALYKHDIMEYVVKNAFARIKTVNQRSSKLEQRLNKSNKALKKTKAELAATQKTLNRKVVRPAVKLAGRIDRLKR